MFPSLQFQAVCTGWYNAEAACAWAPLGLCRELCNLKIITHAYVNPVEQLSIVSFLRPDPECLHEHDLTTTITNWSVTL